MDNEGHPQVRSISEILTEMERLAGECATGVCAEDRGKLFDTSLSIMLEIRVPRMPDSDEELAGMLRDADVGTTYTTEEVAEHLSQSSRRFTDLRGQYRDLVALGRLGEAARLLSPDSLTPLVGWELRPQLRVRISEDTTVASIDHDGATVRCESPEEGLAMLGAILRAHRWTETWRR